MSDSISISELRVEIDEIMDVLNGYRINRIPVNIKSIENTVEIRNKELDCDNIIFDSVTNDRQIVSFLGIKIYRGLEDTPDFIYRHYIYIDPKDNTISDINTVKDNLD